MVDARVVLLVDDDAMQREVMATLLAAEGWSVIEADGGAAALEALCTCGPAPTLVLCDLQMPGLSGSALAEALQKQLATMRDGAATALFAMTATPPSGGVAGYRKVLRKPVDLAVLEGLSSRSSEDKGAPETGAPAEDAEADHVLDPEVLGRLRASLPPESLKALYAMAMDDVKNRIGKLRRAAEAGDALGFQQEAHSLKGSAGMIGARRLSLLASAAERDGIGDGTPEAVAAQFDAEAKALQLMLEVLLDEQRPGAKVPA